MRMKDDVDVLLDFQSQPITHNSESQLYLHFVAFTSTAHDVWDMQLSRVN